jgi:WD40 repeat protein
MKETKFRCIKTLKGHVENVTCVSFSSNGKYFATALDNGILEIWSVE